MAQCKTCGLTHEQADFYESIATYCKEHWRERVKANRAANAERYSAYERQRASLPHRAVLRDMQAGCQLKTGEGGRPLLVRRNGMASNISPRTVRRLVEARAIRPLPGRDAKTGGIAFGLGHKGEKEGMTGGGEGKESAPSTPNAIREPS